MDSLFTPDAVTALVTVILIDVTLAGDNAIAVAMAASGLPPEQRRRAILAGAVLATALRIALALVAARLLAIVGLTLAGGLLLLYVAWKLFLELRHRAPAHEHTPPKRKTFGAALLQVLAADVSMSLDNVLAIAGAAREHFAVLVLGLMLSVALMALAASVLARMMARYRWIGWLGLAMVTLVAIRLIHDGSVEVVHHL